MLAQVPRRVWTFPPPENNCCLFPLYGVSGIMSVLPPKRPRLVVVAIFESPPTDLS